MKMLFKLVVFVVLAVVLFMVLTGRPMPRVLRGASQLTDKIVNEEKELLNQSSAKPVTPAVAEAKTAPVAKQVQTAAPPKPTSSTAPSVGGFGKSDKHPFGDIDWHKIDQGGAQGSVAAPPPQQASSAGGDAQPSMAQQMQNSSNPIIKTWAGYVSNIENMEK